MSAEDDALHGHPRYTKIRNISRGAFGLVQLACDGTTGEFVAIKLLKRGDGVRCGTKPRILSTAQGLCVPQVTKYVQREILNHRRLNHPHIVQLIEVFCTPTHLAVVMEYAPGGDMYNYVLQRRGLAEPDALWFFQQLIIAVDYCHKMGVVNRDIKLENTLLDDSPRPLIRLCDFGYSKHEMLQSAPGSRVGTPAYLAPEIITASRDNTYDGKAADVWACGVMLYVMLCARYPFRRPEDEQLQPSNKLHVMLKRILQVQYELPEGLPVSGACRDLLRRILVADPQERIGIDGIMAHPWFQTNLPAGVVEMNAELVPADVTVVGQHFPGQQVLQDAAQGSRLDVVQEGA